MKPTCAVPFLLALFVILVVPAPAAAQASPRSNDTFYTRSLHFTTKGFSHWYAKEQGGPELITGQPYAAIGCGDCHVGSCDTCHRKEVNGKAVYSIQAARSEAACAKCHSVPTGEKAQADVHARRGMTCMSCHNTREIHGTDASYATYAAPGAVETTCENCHDGAKCKAFTLHTGKVDCSACHARAADQCHNCHLETKMRDKKSISVPLENVLFLVNHEGRVTAGTFLSYTYGKKTMITFGRSFTHSVVKAGRTCTECHGTKIVADVADNRFRFMEWENGAIRNVQGVIPVLDGVRWNAIFLDRKGEQWVRLEGAEEPLIQYSAYCTPLSRQQVDRLRAAVRPTP
jgi:hypothetical protein